MQNPKSIMITGGSSGIGAALARRYAREGRFLAITGRDRKRLEQVAEDCRAAGAGAVVVLGHPEYYPRFGFEPTANFGIHCEFDVPPEVFMVRELTPGYLDGRTGTVSYHAAFQTL